MSVGDWVPFSDMSFGWAGSLSINCHCPCVDWVSSPYQWYELERAGSLSINCPYPFCRLGFESLLVVQTWEGQISVHKRSISLCRWVLRPFWRYKLERGRRSVHKLSSSLCRWVSSPFQWYELERAGCQPIHRPYPYVDRVSSPYRWYELERATIWFMVTFANMNLRGLGLVT